MSQAILESENSPVSHFSHTKVTKFDLAVKKVKVNQGYSLNKLDRIRVSNTAYQVSRSSVPEEKIMIDSGPLSVICVICVINVFK